MEDQNSNVSINLLTKAITHLWDRLDQQQAEIQQLTAALSAISKYLKQSAAQKTVLEAGGEDSINRIRELFGKEDEDDSKPDDQANL